MYTSYSLVLLLLPTIFTVVRGICPLWDADHPCSCTKTKTGVMVQCNGPVGGHRVVAALEAFESSQPWELQLDSLNLEELPASVKTVSTLRISKCILRRLLKTTPLVWPNLNEVVFESVKFQVNPLSQLKAAHFLKSVKISDFALRRSGGHNFRSLPSSVEYLDLRKTSTTKLEPGCLSHLQNLRYVFIADMPISEFSRDVLPYEMPQLHTFILGNTLIDTLEPNFFNGMPELEVLMLNGNKFKTFDPQLFAQLRTHLTHLVAERNPLQCDCNLLSLKRNFQNNNAIRILATCFDISEQEFKEVMQLEDTYCS